MAKTSFSQCRGAGFDAWSGNWISHAATKIQCGQINTNKYFFKKQNINEKGDFPHGPVAKTLCPQCRGPRFNPWSGN